MVQKIGEVGRYCPLDLMLKQPYRDQDTRTLSHGTCRSVCKRQNIFVMYQSNKPSTIGVRAIQEVIVQEFKSKGYLMRCQVSACKTELVNFQPLSYHKVSHALAEAYEGEQSKVWNGDPSVKSRPRQRKANGRKSTTVVKDQHVSL